MKLAANISGDKLVSLGTCFGKFTKTHKFRLHITALDYLAPYAKVCAVVSSLPLGMEEVKDEAHFSAQIIGQLLCHRVPDSAWGQCQHMEMFVGRAVRAWLGPRGTSAVWRCGSSYLQQSRKAYTDPAED